MSQLGDLGSGAGKGGGGGGSIREAGGAFGKAEAAKEEEYFYKKVGELEGCLWRLKGLIPAKGSDKEAEGRPAGRDKFPWGADQKTSGGDRPPQS